MLRGAGWSTRRTPTDWQPQYQTAVRPPPGTLHRRRVPPTPLREPSMNPCTSLWSPHPPWGALARWADSYHRRRGTRLKRHLRRLRSCGSVVDDDTTQSQTIMTYDDLGNLTSVTDPEDGITQFPAHDIMGNVLTRIAIPGARPGNTLMKPMATSRRLPTRWAMPLSIFTTPRATASAPWMQKGGRPISNMTVIIT